MKRLNSSLLVLFMCIASGIHANTAYIVDGIVYSTTGTSGEKELEVCPASDGVTYTGVISIPAGIDIDGVNYKVVGIADDAFNSTSITSITIPEGIQYIGNRAFYLTGIKSATLPASLEQLGEQAFAGSEIISATFLGEDTQLASGSFQQSAIESITLPSNLRSIPSLLFYDSNSLKSITLPESIISIGKSAFYKTAIENITLPQNLSTINDCAFQYCDNLTTVNNSSVKLRIVGEKAFDSCKKLTSIQLPDATIIGTSAFNSCHSLTSANIPNVTSLGISVFNDCLALNEITPPKNLGHIPAYTFQGCKSLPSIDIPASVKTIEASAFKNCSNLSTISGGENLDSIHADAFYYCYSITSLPEMKNLEYIGDRAFLACSEFDWQLPEGLKYVGDQAFYVCNKLKSQLPSTLEHIGELAFMSCEMPSYLIIPDATTYIGKRAFERCGEIDSISFGSGLTEIPEGTFSYISACIGKIEATQRWYEHNGALRYLKIPDNIEVIGKKAFYDCPKLESIEIGDGVYEIGKDAFGGRSPQKISFGKSLKKIGARALYFSSCKEIICNASIPPVFGKEIPDSVYSAVLVVPKGCKELYQNSPVWKNFTNIIESDEEAATTDIIEAIENNDITINITGNSVNITNAGCDIGIYDIHGQTVYYGQPAKITLPTGVYFLKTENISRKFLIK